MRPAATLVTVVFLLALGGLDGHAATGEDPAALAQAAGGAAAARGTADPSRERGPGALPPMAQAVERAAELARGLGPRKPSALALRLVPPPVRAHLLRSGLSLDARALAGLEVTLAVSPADLEASARLVHDMYVRRGITAPDPSGLRVTPHLVHPQTSIFVAKRGDRVVGTISLLVDSPLGVPMEKIYADEVGRLRTAGRLVAEVGALAIAPDERGQGLVHLLNKAMFDHARRLEVDDLVISVHPDVEDLYRATLLFERIGRVKVYPGLNRSALAVPLRLDMRRAPERFRAAYAGRRGFDGYRFYIEEARPEIKLPPWSSPFMSRRRERIAGGAKLLSLRPATVSEASERERQALRAVGVLKAAGRGPARSARAR